jgi:biotin-(acetyl-CoA carboxylase) ligase
VTKLDLPPPYTEIALHPGADAFAHARAVAATAGAGTLVWAATAERLEIAVVLEPEERLLHARGVVFAGMNAIGDALSVVAPPEKPLVFVWPDQIHFNLGLVGGVRLAWPQRCGDDAVPDWLVFGCTLRLSADGEPPPASLVGEGFEDFVAADFVASFAHHFMALLDEWHTGGLPAHLSRWRQRADAPPPAHPDLAAVLAAPSWQGADGEMLG